MTLDISKIVRVMSQKNGFDYTQKDLAADLHCSMQTISNWKKRTNPNADYINRILKLTGLDYNQIWIN
jgi:DNA-binding XRE family transcriptional regulator